MKDNESTDYFAGSSHNLQRSHCCLLLPPSQSATVRKTIGQAQASTSITRHHDATYAIMTSCRTTIPSFFTCGGWCKSAQLTWTAVAQRSWQRSCPIPQGCAVGLAWHAIRRARSTAPNSTAASSSGPTFHGTCLSWPSGLTTQPIRDRLRCAA